MAVDRDDNIIVAGSTIMDTTTHALVLKYDSSGTLLWQKVFAFSTDDELEGASCDSAGDIYVAGYTGAGVNYACLTMKLDTAGNVLWTATYGGSSDNAAYDVACDSAGDPIVAGYVTDSVTGNQVLIAIKYGVFAGIAESHVAGPRPVVTSNTITAAPDFVAVGSLFGPLRHPALRPLRPDQAAGLLRELVQRSASLLSGRTACRHVPRENSCAGGRRLLPEAGAGQVDEGLQVVPIPGLGPWRRRRSHPAPAQEQTELKPLTSGENRVK